MSEDVVIMRYEANREQTELEEEDKSTVTIEITKFEPKRGYCHPDHWLYKSLLLMLICFTVFIAYYCAESPGGLEDTIIKVMGIDTTQYNLLFLVTTWPNVFVSIIGGIIADRILGPRSTYFIMILLIALGQFIWSLGSFVDYFWVVLVGRFAIGSGGMVATTVSKIFLAKWFGKKYLTFALSVNTTAARLGAATALALPQLVYHQSGYITSPSSRLGFTVLVGVWLMIAGIIVTVIMIMMDRKMGQGEFNKSKKIKCSDVKHFSASFWLATIIMIYYSVVFAFTGIGQGFYVQKYGVSLETASIANSFVFSATILATPVIGYIVNAIGYHILWTIGGIISGLIVHIILLASNPGLTYVPYISGVIYSISYTIFASSFWPLVAFLVQPDQIGTAYGIYFSVQNIFWGLLAILSGVIIDNIGYFVLETVYTSLMFLVLMVAVLVLMIDLTSKEHVVNTPGTGFVLGKKKTRSDK